MIGGALGSALAMWSLRRHKEVILAGAGVGVAIALLNMAVEFAGATFDVYYISGPWVLLRTPVPLTLGWVFLTFIFCAGYELVVRRRKRRKAVPLFILAGIVIGCLTDYFFYRYAQILALGENGSPALIGAVWLVFVPLTIFLYEFLMGVLSGNEEVASGPGPTGHNNEIQKDGK